MPLTDETRVAAREIMARYPRPRSALLPMLHLVQSEEGYVTPEGVRFCAEELGLTKAEVGAVATFYTMYKRRPTGEYLVSRLHQHALRRARRAGDLRDAVRAARRRPRPDHRRRADHAASTPSAWPPATTRRSSRSTTSSSTSRRPSRRRELVERAAGGPAAAADPGRAAVHVQGDQPAAGRVRRRAAGRGRRRVGRRADADRHAAGGGARRDGARVRRADPARQAGRPGRDGAAPARAPRGEPAAGRAAPAARRGEGGGAGPAPPGAGPRPSSRPPPARPSTADPPDEPSSGAGEGLPTAASDPAADQSPDKEPEPAQASSAGSRRAQPERESACRADGPADAHEPRAQDQAQGELTVPLTPVLTKRWLSPRSWTLETYEQLEGYQGLRKALTTMTPDEVITWSRTPACAAAAAPASRPA